jgi:hypothetical protein
LAFSVLVLVVALGSGCKTYDDQNNAITQRWIAGDVAGAAKDYTAKAKKAEGGKDALIWRLEQATALRAASDVPASTAAFQQAEATVNAYEEKAKVSVSKETLALLSNQANLPYRGRTSDKVMLNTYQALNYLQAGQPDKARVELTRAYQRQQDAVEENSRRIESAQRAAKESEAAKAAENDAVFQSKLKATYSNLDGLKAYADYVNPFTVWLDGIFFLHQPASASDLERARKSLERALVFAPTNAYVAEDLKALDALEKGQRPGPITYIIFENGRAPSREQVRIDIPIFVTDVPYVGAAFPKLVFHPDAMPALQVSTTNGTHTTAVVASMDSVIGREFKDELPGIVAKTVASTVAKAVASYGINSAAGGSGNDNGLVAFLKIAQIVYQMAVNIADTRSWTTLPKDFQICRIPTPDDRRLTLAPATGGPAVEVILEPAEVNIVFVRAVGPNSRLLVAQARLE